MAVMTVNGIFDWATLILILVAIAINIAIIIRTDKKLHKCHGFLLAGLIVFGVAKLFDILTDFQIITFNLAYKEILESIFVLLFVLGLWEVYLAIRERQKIPRKPIKPVKKQKARKKVRTRRKY